MKQDEYRLTIRNLQLHYQDFIRDSQDSQQFGADDRLQVEADYNQTTQYFDNLLNSMEKGEGTIPANTEPLICTFTCVRDSNRDILELVYETLNVIVRSPFLGSVVFKPKGE